MDGDFNDEHAGKGGSYVVGEGGKRVLQERTDVIAAAPAKPVTKPAKPNAKGDSNA